MHIRRRLASVAITTVKILVPPVSLTKGGPYVKLFLFGTLQRNQRIAPFHRFQGGHYKKVIDIVIILVIFDLK